MRGVGKVRRLGFGSLEEKKVNEGWFSGCGRCAMEKKYTFAGHLGLCVPGCRSGCGRGCRCALRHVPLVTYSYIIYKMLEIKNLHASVEGKEILRGVNLTIGDG